MNNKKRIIIIDDLDLNRILMVEQLKSLNCDIEMASNGGEALVMIKEATFEGKPFDLAIIDHVMPEMTGLETGVEIRGSKIAPNMKMLGYSSKLDSTIKRSYLEAGFEDFLTKPCPPEILIAKVEQILGFSKVSNDINAVTLNGKALSPLVQNLRVLVTQKDFEDSTIAKLLKRSGQFVKIEDDPVSALKLIEDEKFDVVFVEDDMRVMDGIQITKLIKMKIEEGTISSCALVGFGFDADVKRDKYVLSGAMDFIEMPISQDNLNKILSKVKKSA